MTRIVFVGEGMLELSRAPGGAPDWQLGYGGDTLNSAIHLSRFGEDVRYLTALGDDSFSEEMRMNWTREGIDPELILTAPNSTPGMYAIHIDAAGERSFSYWRGESAARRMFALPGTAHAVAITEKADVLAFSLVSLAILPDEGREVLIALATRMKRDGRSVVFDGNYRPSLWADTAEARMWYDQAVAACTIGLPTLDDERAMGNADSAADVAARWRARGASEVVVKLGADGCLLHDGTLVEVPARLRPRDTSGAGDAFNAAYLHARFTGSMPEDAALAGHRLASKVIMLLGAVPSRCDPSMMAAY